MLHYRPWRTAYAAIPGHCASEGDEDGESQGTGVSVLSLLSRGKEKIPCDTGILREMD
jgi:hypothetical protein